MGLRRFVTLAGGPVTGLSGLDEFREHARHQESRVVASSVSGVNSVTSLWPQVPALSGPTVVLGEELCCWRPARAPENIQRRFRVSVWPLGARAPRTCFPNRVPRPAGLLALAPTPPELSPPQGHVHRTQFAPCSREHALGLTETLLTPASPSSWENGPPPPSGLLCALTASRRMPTLVPFRS